MSAQAPVHRPIGVTILAILAGVAAILSGIHLLQSLGILPYFIGTALKFRDFNLWYAIMWGLMVWVWFWVATMLWNVEPQAWIFLVIITVFNLILAFFSLLGTGSNAFSDVSVDVFLNGIILLYCMIPGVRRAFGTE